MKTVPFFIAVVIAVLALVLAAGTLLHSGYQRMTDIGIAASLAVMEPLKRMDGEPHERRMAMSAVEISPAIRELKAAYGLGEVRLYHRTGAQVYPLSSTNIVESRLAGLRFPRSERGFIPTVKFLSLRQVAVMYPVANSKDKAASGCVFYVLDLF